MLDRITGNTEFASLAAPPSASDVRPFRRRVFSALALNASMREMLDRDAVIEAVVARRPDAIVDHATALADLSDLKHFDSTFHQPNLLRTRGTDAVIAAEGWWRSRRGSERTPGLAMSSAVPESLVEKPKPAYAGPKKDER